MPSPWIFLSIAILAGSFFTGFAFFYGLSPLPKAMKKNQLDEVLSLIINFVIFIWIGKIMLHFFIFIKDPLAILAYPSNSTAFYIAVLLTLVNGGYKVIRKKLDALQLFSTFVSVVIIASFTFEFLQIVLNGGTYSWHSLGLLMLLSLLLLFFHGRMEKANLAFILLALWSAGQLVLAFYLPYTSVFGYMLAPWFLLPVFIACLILFVIYNTRRGTV